MIATFVFYVLMMLCIAIAIAALIFAVAGGSTLLSVLAVAFLILAVLCGKAAKGEPLHGISEPCYGAVHEQLSVRLDRRDGALGLLGRAG